jgi:hypothetical protein
MKPRTTIRTLLAAALVAAVTLVPAAAWAGSCTFQISPSPGWRGADITISGFSMGANVDYYVNFDGAQIKTGQTNSNGAMSFHYIIPNSTPVGTVNWFVGSNGCSMDDSRDYTVMATAPTTTTTSTTTTTTIPPTTTTLAPTTTVAAPTTTVAAPTTTVAGDTTTTVAATTTTTVAEEEDGGGIPLVVWIVIAALGGVVLFLVGKLSAGRRR